MFDSHDIHHITESEVYKSAKEYADSHTCYYFGVDKIPEDWGLDAQNYWKEQFNNYIKVWEGE